MRRPFTARSVIASTLLGTVPPVLPGRLLVTLAREFDIAEGTVRVALSRMVERGELTNDGGTYALAGRMLDRQERQEASLRPSTRPWDGTWELVVIRAGARPTEDRSALRTALGQLGLREHREGVWMRPENLDPGRLPGSRRKAMGQTDRFTARPEGDPVALAATLFDLEPWAATASTLVASMRRMQRRLDDGEHAVLVPGFELAAAVLRHLVADPLVPDELLAPDWPAARLRETYADFDVAYRRVLQAFFREHRGERCTDAVHP